MTKGLRGLALFLPLTMILTTELAAQAAQPIGWQTGSVRSVEQSRDELRSTLAALTDGTGGKPRHFVIQFDAPIGASKRDELSTAGVRLLSYLGSHAYFASTSSTGVQTGPVSQIPGLARVQRIERAWKLHPYLAAGKIPDWAVVSGPADPSKPQTIVVGAYVQFHRDAILVPDAFDTIGRHGGVVRDSVRSVNALVVEVPFEQINAMAEEDAVQWIEPPLPQWSAVNNSNRAATGADIVQEAPYELDGAGVKVLIYDSGTIEATHPDLAGRVTIGDSDFLSFHATHVAGTVGGTGAGSSGLFRGMAPAVDILSYGFQWNSEDGVFLYANPGDIEQDYAEAINVHGAVISNNSLGTNTCFNGFPCEITGDYGVTSSLIDTIVAGGLGQPIRVVWANGNERDCPRCRFEGHHTDEGYHSTAPPACAKNQIAVGAVNSNDDSMTVFSSWGPCDDGRLRPDVTAPGCETGDDNGVTSCTTGGGYFSLCGTSMASPTVCGLSALLLQDFRSTFPERDDFRNSTLKALLTHNAHDLGAPGPDFQFGYGSVRIKPTVDFMRTGSFLEDEVGHNGTHSALVFVADGDPLLKVTLAWDDPAGAPNVMTALVNDLDLVVYDPASNQHFPWTLDPQLPGLAAIRSLPDRINNIEQVMVDDPMPGVWRVEVRGFNVPEGSQWFSLCASPLLVNCSTRGAVSLDEPKYDCESSAAIRVSDCDLNADDNRVETVAVSAASDTEPGGEILILTETGDQTADFRGSLLLQTTDAPGVLHISQGDTLTVTYIDMDDGFGNTHIPVATTAVVDCLSPIVLDVFVSDIRPRRATVAFTSDELTLGTIRFGSSCNSLTRSAVDAGFHTVHDVTLAGLSENAVYYFAVDASDQAGNATTDDNGGACYTFVTPDIPDFFTELFGGDLDLTAATLMFAPNGSLDFYEGCIVGIDALPTDPAGGTVLSFLPNMDDGAAFINLSGDATISHYGTSFGSLYVGSNGYITFGTSDGDPFESLLGHFRIPRISGLFHDLNPGAGGSVSWRQLDDRAVVTWLDVPEYFNLGSNTFQIEMFFDGRIAISYLNLSLNRALVGLSAGLGVGPNFFESDLSAMSSCGPRPPLVQNGTATAVEDVPLNIMLRTSDDGFPDPPGHVTVIVASLPEHGVLTDSAAGVIGQVPYPLTGDIAQVVYVPAADYRGPDSFQFKANDGGAPPEGGDSRLALVTIQVDADCNENLIGDRVDIEDDRSQDCNANVVPDECDIASGQSGDCEPDGIPDECTLDCNTNRVMDGCDIRDGVSEDCNTNSVPDECDIIGFGDRFYEITPIPPLRIPDRGFSRHTFHVPDPGTVVDVNVRLNIEHSSVGQLRILLQHGLKVITLVLNCGGDGDNFTNTLLDDEAALPICGGSPPFSGAFFAYSPLADFDGMPMEGDWSLVLRDGNAGAEGMLISWSLLFPSRHGDCNNNALPDDCEPDCNRNGVTDECDLRNGVSPDENGNNVPDECECLNSRGDSDGDADLDLRDIAAFQNCYGGSASVGCACADLDGDGAIDAADIVVLAQQITGP